MYNMIQKRKAEMKKNNKKGFTLVEVIVVLVILAILAAILIPSMIGWIDKANQKSAVVEARSVMLASQTLASENYGNNVTTAPTQAQVFELAEISGSSAKLENLTVTNGKVMAFNYTSTDGYKVSCANGKLDTKNITK